MNFDTIFTALLALLCVVLGLFVLVKGLKTKVNQYFFYFSISLAIWILSSLFARYAIYDSATPFIYTGFAASSMAGYFFLRFSLDFPKNIFKKSKWIDILLLAIPILFFITSFLGLVAIPVREGIDGFLVGQGVLYTPFSIFLFLYIFGGLVILGYKYKKLSGIYKNQVFYVIIGLALTSVFALLTSLVLPWVLNIPDLYKWGIYATVFFVGFTAYAIVAHHLFDIRVIIRRTVVYSVLLVFILAVYSLVIFIFAQAFGVGGEAITVKTIVPNLLAAVFIAAGFEPLRKWLTKTTDKFLFKGEYKPQDVLNKLSNVLSSVLDLDEALTSIIGILVKEMRLTRAGAFVLTHDPESKKMIVKRAKSVGYGEEKITLKPDGSLITYYEQYIKSHKEVTCKEGKDEEKRIVKKCNIKIDSKPIITEELEREVQMNQYCDEVLKNTISELKSLNAQVSLPIIVKGKLIGVFVLGAKKSGDVFTDSDLELLSSVANQTAAAIEKARFYEEDQLKSEFVSIASHELLTPTSAIEGYLSMILDEGMGKVDPQAKKYLDNVYTSSKRLASLVKDLLNVSRIEGGRIVVQSKNFDLKKMIDQVVQEMEPKAKEKGLQFTAEGVDREVPQVWADPERVHQVLINLIGNAIKYTDKGSVRVRIDFSLSVVRVSVIDTGVGIPKDEIPHLFEKFYRASNADNSGAQGTGLGLYITKQIVELMGGMIQVDSEKGKGSVFSFSLPKAKDEKTH